MRSYASSSVREKSGSVPEKERAEPQRGHALRELQHSIGNQALTRALTASRFKSQSHLTSSDHPPQKEPNSNFALTPSAGKSVGAAHKSLQRKADLREGPPTGHHLIHDQSERSAASPMHTSNHVPPKISAPLIAMDAARMPGEPLPPHLQREAARHYGHDFGHVRVHFDDNAASATSSLHASAYTIGGDVVFGARRYAPDTLAGRLLLHHELRHVAQQRHAAPVQMA